MGRQCVLKGKFFGLVGILVCVDLLTVPQSCCQTEQENSIMLSFGCYNNSSVFFLDGLLIHIGCAVCGAVRMQTRFVLTRYLSRQMWSLQSGWQGLQIQSLMMRRPALYQMINNENRQVIECKPSERLRTSLAEGRSLVFASRILPTISGPSIEESST